MAPRIDPSTSIPTYSLRADNFTADEFYGDLALFTDETLLRLRVLDSWVASFRAHLAIAGADETRSSGEYLYELLALAPPEALSQPISVGGVRLGDTVGAMRRSTT